MQQVNIQPGAIGGMGTTNLSNVTATLLLPVGTKTAWIAVRATASNSSPIWIGDSTLTTPTVGLALRNTDPPIILPIDNAATPLYALAAVNNEDITWMYGVER